MFSKILGGFIGVAYMELAYTLISHRSWSFVCHNYASLYVSMKLIFGTFWFYNLKHIFFVFPCFTGIYLLQVTHFYAIKMRMITTNDNPKIPGLLHLSLRPYTSTTNGWNVADPLRDQSSVPKNKGYRLPYHELDKLKCFHLHSTPGSPTLTNEVISPING